MYPKNTITAIPMAQLINSTTQMMQPTNSDCLSPNEIVGYLAQSLNTAQTRRVEAHLIDCPLCDAALTGFANSHNPQQVAADIAQVQAAFAKKQPATKPQKMPTFPKIWAAAAVVIAMLLGTYFYCSHNAVHTQLFAQNFAPITAAKTVERGEAAVAKTTLEQGFAAYSQGDYKGSLVDFENVLSLTPNDYQTALYAGCAALSTQDWAKAEKYLEQAHLGSDAAISSDAVWYLALLQLAKGNKVRAAEFLQELATGNNSDYTQKAKDLLQKIAAAQ